MADQSIVLLDRCAELIISCSVTRIQDLKLPSPILNEDMKSYFFRVVVAINEFMGGDLTGSDLNSFSLRELLYHIEQVRLFLLHKNNANEKIFSFIREQFKREYLSYFSLLSEKNWSSLSESESLHLTKNRHITFLDRIKISNLFSLEYNAYWKRVVNSNSLVWQEDKIRSASEVMAVSKFPFLSGKSSSLHFLRNINSIAGREYEFSSDDVQLGAVSENEIEAIHRNASLVYVESYNYLDRVGDIISVSRRQEDAFSRFLETVSSQNERTERIKVMFNTSYVMSEGKFSLGQDLDLKRQMVACYSTLENYEAELSNFVSARKLEFSRIKNRIVGLGDQDSRHFVNKRISFDRQSVIEKIVKLTFVIAYTENFWITILDDLEAFISQFGDPTEDGVLIEIHSGLSEKLNLLKSNSNRKLAFNSVVFFQNVNQEMNDFLRGETTILGLFKICLEDPMYTKAFEDDIKKEKDQFIMKDMKVIFDYYFSKVSKITVDAIKEKNEYAIQRNVTALLSNLSMVNIKLEEKDKTGMLDFISGILFAVFSCENKINEARDGFDTRGRKSSLRVMFKFNHQEFLGEIKKKYDDLLDELKKTKVIEFNARKMIEEIMILKLIFHFWSLVNSAINTN